MSKNNFSSLDGEGYILRTVQNDTYSGTETDRREASVLARRASEGGQDSPKTKPKRKSCPPLLARRANTDASRRSVFRPGICVILDRAENINILFTSLLKLFLDTDLISGSLCA